MKTIFNTPFSTSIKALFAILLITASSLQSFAGPKLDIHIEFGRKSMGCTRFSICNHSHEFSTRINATFENTGKALSLSFVNEALIGHDGQIQNGYFIMEEDYVINDADKKLLSLPASFVIKTGKYKAVKTDSGWVVVFPF